jgi:hypothetical protein
MQGLLQLISGSYDTGARPNTASCRPSDVDVLEVDRGVSETDGGQPDRRVVGPGIHDWSDPRRT